MLATLEYAKPLQVETELSQLLQLLEREKVTSYLEIGARYGGSFETIMGGLPHGSRGYAVDFPGGNFGDAESAPIFLGAVNRLRNRGYQVDYVFGPSACPEVIDRVSGQGPFGAVLIDGDHSYDAVRRDFDNYSQMGRMVILHDIAAPVGTQSKAGRLVEVPYFWAEIKNDFRHVEIIAPNTNMGIGVLWP